MNKNLLKIFTAAVVLSATASTQAFAHSWATKDCSDENGIGCWQCGTTCTATLYGDGKLVVSGTGVVAGGGGGNSTFSGLEVKPTSLVIEEGITSVESNALWCVSTITSLDIADSFVKVNPDGLNFTGTGLTQLTIGANSPLTKASFSDYRMPIAENFEVNCRGDMNKCKEKESLYTDFGAKTISYVKRDESGILLEQWNWDSDGNGFVFDSQGNLLAKYSKTGALLSQYSYNNDGSIGIYDANGKLTGLKNAKSITPAQAAALIKKCNCNTVKLTFK